MRNDWMLDVLTDLKRFAQLNGMPGLADKLSETVDVAAIEITLAEEAGRGLNGREFTTRAHIGATGGCAGAG